MAKSDLLIKPDTDRDLLSIIDDEIAGGISFATDSERDDRRKALEYYRGEMRDLPADPDWSKAVSRDVANTVDFQLPGLMRVFAGAGQIVTYNPTRPGDEDWAAQATDYVNYLWDNELDGYRTLFDGIHDGLLIRNGIIKVYWDPTPEYETQDLTGLSDDELTYRTRDPSVQIVASNSYEQPIQDPATGQVIMLPLFDVRLRHVSINGRMRLECVPPEDFGLASGTIRTETSRMVWHYARKTRSDLVKEGYDQALVAEMPAYAANPSGDVERDQSAVMKDAPAANTAMQQVEVYECYLMYDADGDGIAERRKVVVCGAAGAREILSDDPWPDDLPFVDLTPMPVPHRWEGKSTADDVMDIQRPKTALLRQMLDNLYLVNRPQRQVVERDIISPDEVMRPKIGGVIRVKNPNAVTDLVTPFVGDKAMLGLNYFDSVIKQRTGVGQATMALDSTALDPQTATAEQIDHDASYARTELVARNFAELGLKPLFAKMLRIICRNQDRPRTIQLRGKWVEMDPRAWNANMHATINVGLGTGSRERDLAMLAGVAKQQDMVVAQMGLINPIVPPSKWIGTRHKMVEAAGLRNPDQYFTPVSDQEFEQWQASQPPKPDPKMIEAQQRTQIHGQKAQADIALKGQKAQADVVTDRQKSEQDFALRQAELHGELALKAYEIAHDTNDPNKTNVRRPQ